MKRPRPGPPLDNAERAAAMLGDVIESLQGIAAGEHVSPQLVLVELANLDFVRKLLRGDV